MIIIRVSCDWGLVPVTKQIAVSSCDRTLSPVTAPSRADVSKPTSHPTSKPTSQLFPRPIMLIRLLSPRRQLFLPTSLTLLQPLILLFTLLRRHRLSKQFFIQIHQVFSQSTCPKHHTRQIVRITIHISHFQYARHTYLVF